MDRNNDLSAWRLFCLAAAAGSLKAACQGEGIDSYVASRAIAALEASLGEPLFDRTTRPAKLTLFGRRAYREMAPVVAAHRRALRLLRLNAQELEGPVTVATHAAFGSTFLPEMLMEFQVEHPGIETEWMELTPEKQNALLTTGETPIDVAQCYGPLPDSPGAHVSPLGDMHFLACASPLYLARFGTPASPEDCASHTGLLLESDTRTSVAELVNGSRRAPVLWQRTMRFQNLASALQAAKLGAGILPDLPAIYLIDAGAPRTLVPVMPGWSRPPLPCFMLVNPQSAELARVRLFADWFTAKCNALLQA